MFKPHFTKQFKKDYNKVQKSSVYNIKKLDQIISRLALGKSLEPKFKDHPLKGNYLGCRECHIYPDWLLIYMVEPKNKKITFVRTGSHSELTVTASAKALKVTRKTLSQLLNGKAGVSPKMAIKLSKAFNTTPELWLNLQQQYDLFWAMKETDCDDIPRLNAS